MSRWKIEWDSIYLRGNKLFKFHLRVLITLDILDLASSMFCQRIKNLSLIQYAIHIIAWPELWATNGLKADVMFIGLN